MALATPVSTAAALTMQQFAHQDDPNSVGITAAPASSASKRRRSEKGLEKPTPEHTPVAPASGMKNKGSNKRLENVTRKSPPSKQPTGSSAGGGRSAESRKRKKEAAAAEFEEVNRLVDSIEAAPATAAAANEQAAAKKKAKKARKAAEKAAAAAASAAAGKGSAGAHADTPAAEEELDLPDESDPEPEAEQSTEKSNAPPPKKEDRQIHLIKKEGAIVSKPYRTNMITVISRLIGAIVLGMGSCLLPLPLSSSLQDPQMGNQGCAHSVFPIIGRGALLADASPDSARVILAALYAPQNLRLTLAEKKQTPHARVFDRDHTLGSVYAVLPASVSTIPTSEWRVTADGYEKGGKGETLYPPLGAASPRLSALQVREVCASIPKRVYIQPTDPKAEPVKFNVKAISNKDVAKLMNKSHAPIGKMWLRVQTDAAFARRRDAEKLIEEKLTEMGLTEVKASESHSGGTLKSKLARYHVWFKGASSTTCWEDVKKGVKLVESHVLVVIEMMTGLLDHLQLNSCCWSQGRPCRNFCHVKDKRLARPPNPFKESKEEQKGKQRAMLAAIARASSAAFAREEAANAREQPAPAEGGSNHIRFPSEAAAGNEIGIGIDTETAVTTDSAVTAESAETAENETAESAE